jgi:hypothetical protein
VCSTAAPGNDDDVSDPSKQNVSKATRDAERREAQMPADAGREPTADEAEAAERNTVDPEVARAEKEAAERGPRQQGEGRIA